MAFGFSALPIAPQGPAGGVDLGAALARLGGQGGYPAAMDPSAVSQPAAAPAAQAPPQAAQQSAQPSYDIHVSPWETALSMLANGGTPGEAAQAVRAVKLKNMMDSYQLQQAQIRMQALSGATPQQQQAMLFNPGEYGKSVAANFAPIQTSEGASQTMFGGATQPGGYSTIAPKLMLGPAGQQLALTQNGSVALGPQLAGKKTAANGVIMDENLGPQGSYSSPQTVAGRLYPFQAGYDYRPPGPVGPLEAIARATGLPAPGAAQSAPAAAPTAPAGQGGKPLDGAAFFHSFILPHEGGLNPHDMNGSPTNYGINQAANPNVNVAKLTPAQAQDIFVKKYWGPSGAANLPPALAGVHADTYFINPKMAQSFLQQSGGDPNSYLGLREAWMQNLVQNNPHAAPYAKAWTQRNDDLQQFINANGGGAPGGQGGAQAQQSAVGTQTVGPDGAVHFQGGIGAPIGNTGQPLTSPQDRAAAGIPASDTRPYIRGEDGLPKVVPQEYDAAWDRGQRDSFMGNEAVKQYTSVVQPSYSALVKNIGQMTGPAAFATLDTTVRTFNPGAVTRQQQLDAMEHMFGFSANFVGKLMSFEGKGSIPKNVQQQILDSVAPFAQSHYDAAKSLYDANTSLATSHDRKPSDVTVPIGDRPERYVVPPTGTAVPESQVIAEAHQAIQSGVPKAKVLQRLQAYHINAQGF